MVGNENSLPTIFSNFLKNKYERSPHFTLCLKKIHLTRKRDCLILNNRIMDARSSFPNFNDNLMYRLYALVNFLLGM